MGNRLRRLAAMGPVLLCLIAAIVGVRILDPWPLHSVREAGIDFLQRTWPIPPPDAGNRLAVAVDIDDDSLAEFGAWPWPRVIIAEIVDRLREAGAIVIALDMDFIQPDTSDKARVEAYLATLPASARTRLLAAGTGDEALVAAMRGTRVVLGSGGDWRTPRRAMGWPVFVNRGEDARRYVVELPGVFESQVPFRAAAKGVGVNMVTWGEDQVVRCANLLFRNDDQLYPYFGLEIARVALGHASAVVRVSKLGVEAVQLSPKLWVPTDRVGCMRPAYVSYDTVPRLSVRELMGDPAAAQKFRNRIVIVGSTAKTLSATWPTLAGPMPNLLVTATVVEALIRGDILRRPSFSDGAEMTLTSVVCVVAALLVPFAAGLLRWAAGLLVVAVPLGVSLWAYVGELMLVDGTYAALSALIVSITAALVPRPLPLEAPQAAPDPETF